MNITELCFKGNLAALQKDLSDHPEHLLHEETHQVGDLTVRLTPLFAATLAGQVQLAAHLLKLGASRSLSGNPLDFYTWICMAPKEKRWELLKLLPTGECSSLFQSIASGGTIWMQTPSSPELKMPNGLSPLHAAIIANTLNELPQRFVHPADGNKLIPFAGLSPVQLATFRVAIHCLFQNRIHQAVDDAYCEEVEIAILTGNLASLCDHMRKGWHPAKPFVRGPFKDQTPLYLAADRGQVEVVRYFIGKGADPESALIGGEHDGITPLFAAARNGHLEMVKYFVRRGICPKASLRTGQWKGWTPCAIAKKCRHRDIVSYLNKYGCDSDHPLPTEAKQRSDRQVPTAANQRNVIVSTFDWGYEAVAERVERWKAWATTSPPPSTEPGTLGKLWNSLPVMSDAEFAAFIYRN